MKKIVFFASVCLPLFVILFSWQTRSATAFEVGKTYDQSNYQEISELLIPPYLNWVKNGDYSLTTAELEYEWKRSDYFIQMSEKNKGVYDIDAGGILIEKESNKPVTFYYGYPFPTISSKDPKAGQKIMENLQCNLLSTEAYSMTAQVGWVDPVKGLTRDLKSGADTLCYVQRSGGPLDNPNNYRKCTIILILEPFDLRGTSVMTLNYNDKREDTVLSYVPMLRRVRRSSAASRSDPFMGSDTCNDDGDSWTGKNSTMDWKLIGEGQFLCPILNTKKIVINELPDGSFERVFVPLKMGYETPGWQGVSWAPVGARWVIRSAWMVEAFPKDPYYNYGKHIYYVDKKNYIPYFKVIYDRSGEYWKTLTLFTSYQTTQTGIDAIGFTTETYIMVDDRSRHATESKLIEYPNRRSEMRLPLNVMGPGNFTTANLIQISK